MPDYLYYSGNYIHKLDALKGINAENFAKYLIFPIDAERIKKAVELQQENWKNYVPNYF
jgi:hypothetical protein